MFKYVGSALALVVTLTASSGATASSVHESDPARDALNQSPWRRFARDVSEQRWALVPGDSTIGLSRIYTSNGPDILTPLPGGNISAGATISVGGSDIRVQQPAASRGEITIWSSNRNLGGSISAGTTISVGDAIIEAASLPILPSSREPIVLQPRTPGVADQVSQGNILGAGVPLPAPIPASLPLMASALAGLAWSRRRKAAR